MLVRRYQDLAMRTAYLVAPEADAADAVQEAFLKAFAALGRFREGAPVRPWLLRIVANEARGEPVLQCAHPRWPQAPTMPLLPRQRRSRARPAQPCMRPSLGCVTRSAR